MELLLDQVQIHTRGARKVLVWEESKIWGGERGNVENRMYNK
jgi:hypothetical protein